MALDRYQWKQPLSELAEVHLCGLYGYFFIISAALFSNISQRQDGILHVVEIVQVGKFSNGHYFVELSHVPVPFTAHYFVPERAVQLGFNKTYSLRLC